MTPELLQAAGTRFAACAGAQEGKVADHA